jgi:hypothetical protein
VKPHNVRQHTWVVLAAALVLLVAHIAVLRFVVRGHLSLALIAAVLAIALLKFAWWKSRTGR